MSSHLAHPEQINLRHNLLTAARDQLHLQWEKRCDAEFATADHDGRAPVLPDPPTTEAILELAETFFTFVIKA